MRLKNCLVTLCLLWLAGPLWAQAQAPSTEQMVEQLRPLRHTRGMRNLTVQEAHPSLSLSLQFDFDSARIRAESYLPLGNLASALAQPALLQSRFVIEGHTDAQGSADYNRRLSQQRAQAVQDWLVSQGVAADRLVALGKGSLEPANPEAPLGAENRRVKIINLD